LFAVLTPVIGGAAIAYLANPILNFFEKRVLHRIRYDIPRRMFSIFFTYLFFILVIAAIGLLIIPQLINSVKALVSQYENYMANAITNLNALIAKVTANFPALMPDGAGQEFLSLDKINALLETLLGNAGDLFNLVLENIKSYGAKLFSTISNVILSLFISFYLLASKEKRLAQIKKLTTAVFSEKQNAFIYKTAQLAHTTFGGFLGGKLLDALIVGVVYFIAFSIVGIPYAPMLATIMGVMNIIPFFGPIIGTIPSVFIVLISAPEKVLLLIILIVIVGQIDGNIIEPKVLSDRTGVSSLCVIIAISVMGNLWGILGMIVGVPLFAVIIALIQQFADAKLGQKGLSTDLDDYYDESGFFPPQETDEEVEMEDAHQKSKRPRLSPRYYLALVAFYFRPKSKRGEKPCFEDYMIQPVADSQVEDGVAEDAVEETAEETVIEPAEETAEDATESPQKTEGAPDEERTLSDYAYDLSLDEETRETLEEQYLLDGFDDLGLEDEDKQCANSETADEKDAE
jgi:predicted PurR-regulated permease PerM